MVHIENQIINRIMIIGIAKAFLLFVMGAQAADDESGGACIFNETQLQELIAQASAESNTEQVLSLTKCGSPDANLLDEYNLTVLAIENGFSDEEISRFFQSPLTNPSKLRSEVLEKMRLREEQRERQKAAEKQKIAEEEQRKRDAEVAAKEIEKIAREIAAANSKAKAANDYTSVAERALMDHATITAFEDSAVRATSAELRLNNKLMMLMIEQNDKMLRYMEEQKKNQ